MLLYDFFPEDHVLRVRVTFPDGRTQERKIECDTDSFREIVFGGIYYNMTAEPEPYEWIQRNSSSKYAQHRTFPSEKSARILCVLLGTDHLSPTELYAEADVKSRDGGYYIHLSCGDCLELYEAVISFGKVIFDGTGRTFPPAASGVSFDLYCR